jgi:hypothetical protein
MTLSLFFRFLQRYLANFMSLNLKVDDGVGKARYNQAIVRRCKTNSLACLKRAFALEALHWYRRENNIHH